MSIGAHRKNHDNSCKIVDVKFLTAKQSNLPAEIKYTGAARRATTRGSKPVGGHRGLTNFEQHETRHKGAPLSTALTLR